jgi:CheY-like chemotaxis protein
MVLDFTSPSDSLLEKGFRWFPQSESPGDSGSLAATKWATDRRPMRVLIVEDNRDQAQSLAMVLNSWGFQTAIAYDGPSGLHTAIQAQPDAILLDIGLPGLNGFEVATQLKGRGEFARTLMAAVTAYGDPDSIERSRQAGFAKHFSKPVDLVALHRFLDDEREFLSEKP